LELSPTALADVLGRERVMDMGVRPLWDGMPRVAGPAFTVRCPVGENLMLHAAIYRAPAGSVIVVESGDLNYALCGGNVCAVAQKLGVAAFVLDGVIRDVAETRERKFPVFCRGIIPIPGGKDEIGELNVPVTCGGVRVSPGDMIVADEEGIVAVPVERLNEVFGLAQKREQKEANTTLEQWEAAHRKKVEESLKKKGFAG
jgi:4-hydroxy-4-methyl-2-oxoglutarate aldolase